MKVKLTKQDGRSGLRRVGTEMNVLASQAKTWIKLGIAEAIKVKRPAKRKANGPTSK